MKRVKFLLGVAWASPVTLVILLFYVLPFVALGWYKYLGFMDLAGVFVLSDTAPQFIKSRWKRWGGFGMGNVVVLRQIPDLTTRASQALLTHEMTHVRQTMILGVFMPLMYGLCMLFGKVLQKTIGRYDAYYDNIFELHARRCAGQVVDVVGTVEKIQAQKNAAKS
jgi:hypothetical protein